MLCLKAAARICFSVRVWFSKIEGLNFFPCLIFFPVFMNLLVKIDRHNRTLWTTEFFNTVFCLVSCLSKNPVPYFKAVTDSNLARLLLRKKKKKKTVKKKNAFRSGLPICHELWDIVLIFLALSQLFQKQISETHCMFLLCPVLAAVVRDSWFW